MEFVAAALIADSSLSDALRKIICTTPTGKPSSTDKTAPAWSCTHFADAFRSPVFPEKERIDASMLEKYSGSSFISSCLRLLLGGSAAKDARLDVAVAEMANVEVVGAHLCGFRLACGYRLIGGLIESVLQAKDLFPRLWKPARAPITHNVLPHV